MNREPEIRTAAGVLRGRREGPVAVFRGIPYAQPPVGPRRFAAPVPARSWDGVRAADEFGPPVPQQGRGGLSRSSDWLTLNVWSPDLGAAGLPVMVWVCGGGYVQCRSDNPHHDGATLAAAGAVVVSMNYRVGVEGFAHITGAPDNRGILDQAAALRWVQDTITAFGGDAGNVTVLGQSAGAGSIASLLAMPSAAGLFRRAIAQSVPSTFLTTDLAAVVSAAVAGELGARATVDELAGIPPGDLLRAVDTVTQRMLALVGSWGPMATTPTPFSPVVDGDVLPIAPWPALAGGAARGVDLVVGHTRDEHRLYVLQHEGAVTEEQAAAALDLLAPPPDGPAAYRAAHPDGPATLFEIVNADWLMRMPSLHLAEAQVGGGGRAWVYELGWGYGPNGASHGLDVLLVLDTIDYDEVGSYAAAEPDAVGEAREVARRMRADWIAFATTGDPGWAPYDVATRPTRVYDAEVTTRPYPEAASRRIWRRHRFGSLGLGASARAASEVLEEDVADDVETGPAAPSQGRMRPSRPHRTEGDPT